MRISAAIEPLLLINDNEIGIEDMYNKFKDTINNIM